ncbi:MULTISPECIES: helix-turn-helix domain-containing protein [unclassified Microcoleus]|uniref:helix-turn-helix domain-containing protein n=1 Tax=unclassified Microcoleus TaxID=2642155 RepID=UPI002FCEFFBE
MQTKIQGKFYPLQHDEWVKVCKDLSSRARDVLYYIRTADPYSNGVEITAAAIARELDCNRSTVSRALKELDAKGYIEMEILAAKVSVTGKGLLDVAELQPRCKNATASAELQQPPQICNDLGEIATYNANLQQASAETVAAIDVQPSKTLKTYSDLLKTLSEGMRESFEKFCLKKIEECSFKIGSRRAWLNKHGAEYLEEFKETYSEALSNAEPIAPKAEIALPDILTLQKMYGENWESAATYYGLISPNSPTVENQEAIDW